MIEERAPATGQTVLFVDYEPAVLDGYQRLLRRDFQLEVACGGRTALRTVEANAPYAVIVVDMRMPEMNGIELLERVKALSPDTVRMMLTGNADIDTAINAVNAGSVFRFLTKPVSKEVLAKALNAGLMQYRLVTAEKELLEKTLSGTVRVLTDVLSLVNPAAFARATRLRRYIHHIVNSLGLSAGWRFEMAAMLSQLGCVTLDPETINAVYSGRKLTAEEQARFDAHPLVACNLLSNIPRLEPIARIIAQQNDSAAQDETVVADLEVQDVPLGVQMLRASLQFDRLITAEVPKVKALSQLSERQFDARIVAALGEIDPEFDAMEPRSCLITELATGMVLDQEVKSNSGLLIGTKGQEINYPLLLRLRSFRQKQAISDSVLARVPSTGTPQAS